MKQVILFVVVCTLSSCAKMTPSAELTDFTKELITLFFQDKYTHGCDSDDYDIVIYSSKSSNTYYLSILLSEKDMYINDAIKIMPGMVGGETVYGKYRTYYVGENNPMFGCAQFPFKDKKIPTADKKKNLHMINMKYPNTQSLWNTIHIFGF